MLCIIFCKKCEIQRGINLFSKAPNNADDNDATASDVEIVESDSPKRKKAETEAEAPRDVEEEILSLQGRILIKANAVMALTSFEGRCVEADVKVGQDKKKSDWFSASVKCPICNKILQLAFAHRTSTSLANFKRHFSFEEGT